MTLDDWKSLTLGEFVRLQRGHDLTEVERRPGTVPVFGSAGQNGCHDEALARGPGVVIGRSGDSMGVVSYAPTDFWPHNTVLYVTDFLGNSRRFAYYFLGWLRLRRFDSGSAQASLNRNFVYPIPIQAPHRDEQERIAKLLGALDDKIELNRRMNETLEAMARAIFKDWFVAFGPTRAKMEGHPPYLAPDLWALFPDRLDAEGKPDGWPTRRVEELLELAYGKSLPATVRTEGPYPVYGSGGVTGFHADAITQPPCIVVGRKGTVGSLFWDDRPCFPIDTVFYVLPKAPMTFCFYLLGSLGLETMNTDAAVPGLNRSNVYRLDGAWGTPELRVAFDGLVAVKRQKMFANDEENRTLAATRDLLLPRLMSGKLRVKDAEPLVAEVA